MNYLAYGLSLAFERLVRLRNACFNRGIFRQYKSLLPIISIGNITVGGNGKTPLVLFTAELLKEHEPVILLRGYGGEEKGPYLVSEDDDPSRVGDEALLLKKNSNCPVVIAARRVAGARFIEKNQLGKLIILDDGFQHRWLARDVDIVSIDVGSKEKFEDLIGGKLLPFGMCRESPAKAFKRVGAVVLTDRGKRVDMEAARKQLLKAFAPQGKLMESSFVLDKIVPLSSGEPELGKSIVAFCGLASPGNFFDMLREQGYNLLAEKAFSDHHAFTSSDIASLQKEFPDAALVCTEKDAVKINPSWGKRVFYTIGAVKLADEKVFKSFLESKI